MKAICIICTMLFFLNMTAIAQDKVGIHVGAGLNLPLSPSDFKDNHYWGYSGTLGVGYCATPRTEAVVHINYYSFGLNADAYLGSLAREMMTAETQGGAIRLAEFGIDIKQFLTISQPNTLRPFLVFGLSMIRASYVDFTIYYQEYIIIQSRSARTNKPAFNVGAGIEAPLSYRLRGYMDIRYIYMATDVKATTYMPVNAGIRIRL